VDEKERLLTPEQAAEILTVSPKTIRDWLRSRKLRGVKAGRQWRIRREDLDKFLWAPMNGNGNKNGKGG